VLGGNDTGKSSLIKSIYQALGAEPAKINPRWKAAEVKLLLKFSVDGVRYQILRDGTFFAIFDGQGNFIKSFTRVVAQLSPFLSNLFDFKLVLASREDEAHVPPPAYLFLPFYMDQDSSWSDSWSAFSSLWQYTGWREPLVEYHAGVRNNAYYSTSAEMIRRRSEHRDAAATERGVSKVLGKLTAESKAQAFTIDPAAFTETIKRLLGESQLLATAESELRTKLNLLNNDLLLQKTRLEIAKKALGEISADFTYLAKVGMDIIECPTCGVHYQNDFAARFTIATDEVRVIEFIAHVEAEIARTQDEIDSLYAEFAIARGHAERIQAILKEEQQQISLEILIESEGRRAADNLLVGQMEEARNTRVTAETAYNAVLEELKALDKHALSTKRERFDEYEVLLRSNFAALDVSVFSQGVFQALNPTIIETGSTLPRSLLGYQFAIFTLISKYSPSTVCPLVIDSPNQQGQDGQHLPEILKFIAAHQPADSQLILGLETTLDIDFGGKTINTPTEKRSLLQKDQYEDVRSKFAALMKAALRAGTTA
jgi:hypothetical protein